jgi:hypothetical protein
LIISNIQKWEKIGYSDCALHVEEKNSKILPRNKIGALFFLNNWYEPKVGMVNKKYDRMYNLEVVFYLQVITCNVPEIFVICILSLIYNRTL